MMQSLLALLLMTITGGVIVRALTPGLRGAAFAGSAFLVGSGAAALSLFALSAAGIAWSRTAVVLTLLALTAIAALLSRLRGGMEFDRQTRPYPRAALAMDLATLAIIASYARFALIRPLYEWDFFGIWGLKGRFFFEARSIDWTFIRTNISHPDYPLLVPLTFDYVSVLRGGWAEDSIALWYVAVSAALVLIVRGMAFDELGSHTAAAAVTLAVASPSMNIWIGLAEAPVMAFGCAGLILMRRGFRIGDPRLIRLAAVMLGLAAWSKNEGLALIAVAAAATFLHRWKLRDVLSLWPAAALIAPWLVTRALLRLSTSFLEDDVLSRVLARLGQPVKTLVAYAASPPDQLLLWLVAGFILPLYARRFFHRERFLYAAVAMQTILFLAQGLATRVDFRAHVSLTMNRIPQQILPAVVFLAAVVLLTHLMSHDPARREIVP
jgi:hypothetical protein